jgi:radical SAM protein with 4Fe4S-binding SPASM domain
VTPPAQKIQSTRYHKLFESKTFCMLPWIHMSVWPDGKVLPCCMAENDQAVGDTREKPLKDIWNGEDMRAIRRNMLGEKKSRQCAKCYELEEAGFPSLRKRINQQFRNHYPLAATTAEDGSVDYFQMAYMDVRFSNICNFRCRTCVPELSSSWYEEAALFWGPHPAAKTKLIRPTADPEDLWRQIEPLLDYVEEIYFAGGEPLIMEEHYRILNRLVEKRRFHVRLIYNTNFSLTTHHGTDAMKLWDKFEIVRIGASLDGMEERGEYLRKGQRWEQVVKNRKRMFEVCPRAEFQISPTLSVMNALHLPDFHREWLEKGFITDDGAYINILLVPEEYRVQVLPKALKEKLTEKYERHIESVVRPSGERSAFVEERFRSALNFANAQDMSHLVPKFKEQTAKLDKIRGESFFAVFPELAALTA